MSCCPVTFQSDARKPPPSLGVSAASALNVASDTAEALYTNPAELFQEHLEKQVQDRNPQARGAQGISIRP